MLKIKNQLLIIILILSLTPLAVTIIVASQEASVMTEKLELAVLKNKALSESFSLELELKSYTGNAITLAQTPAIKKLSMMNHEELSYEESVLAKSLINRMLGYWEDIMRVSPHLLKIEFTDVRGNVVASILRTDEGLVKNVEITKDKDYQEIFAQEQKGQHMEGEVHITKFYEYNLKYDRYIASYSTPVLIENAHRGHIIIDFFSDIIFEDYESIFILDMDYNIIKSENALKNPNYNYLEDNLEEFVEDGFFDGDSNEFETQDLVDIAWIKHHYDKHDQTNFVVVVITSDVEVVTQFNDFLMVLFLATGTVVSIVVLLVARTVSRPISAISNLAKNIGEGKISQVENNSSIVEISELSSSINMMSDKINKKDIQKNEFAAMIIHEIKTPIVPIQGHAEMLIDNDLGKLNHEQEKSLEEIIKHLKVLTNFVDRLMLIHKMELNQFEFNPEKINLKMTINDILTSHAPTFEKQGIKTASSVAENIYINVDIKNLKEVFTNLIQNAVDFVPEKSGEISISAKKINNFIEITVKDNGIGISPEHQKLLFKEKFYQVDKSLKRKHGGSGLGLYICSMIIKQHKGTISINSDLNKGCEIIIKIPQ